MLTPIQITESAGVLTCIVGEARGSFAGRPSERAYLLNIHRQPEVHAVSYNGAPVPALGARQAFEAASSGWWWNNGKKILAIKLPRTAKSLSVQVS
ncbi:MAG TPA: DUF5110 domain-containing protein [Methylomirabilota bacterium]|nr:DUF5110 domain-containing protein [Methylomirabilota bacterium]